MTSPLSPIELAGTAERLPGETTPLPDGFVEQLGSLCEIVTDLAARAEVAR